MEASEMRDRAETEAAAEFSGEGGGILAAEAETGAGATILLERRRTMMCDCAGI